MNCLILFSLAILIAICTATTATDSTLFASKLFYYTAKAKSKQNVIISPISIQSCLALMYLGAESTTANEIQTSLQFGDAKEDVAEEFGKLMAKTKTQGLQLKMANRVYLNKKYEISPEFNTLARKYFDTKAEIVNFTDSATTANLINSWVEEQTENRIKNVISASSLSAETITVLINTIYFKAQWKKQFSGYARKNFHVNKNEKVLIDMMMIRGAFLYGELNNLDATAIEIPYSNSNIKMLVILPNDIDGLAQLEEKLKDVDLTKISEQFQMDFGMLRLPKFKVEFTTSLIPAFKDLGMKTMFTGAADFSNLLTTKEPLTISVVRHKVFIDVDKHGTEAAAATSLKIMPVSMPHYAFNFLADHPFFYAIQDNETVYFAGHIAKF